MKNINLTPHSFMPVKGSRGKKPFVFIPLFLLMLLSVVFFSLYISSYKQGQGNFLTQIGSLFNTEKPNKLIKISLNKRNSTVEKHSKPQSKEKEHVENINKVETEKEGPISEETDSETTGIEIEEDEDFTKVDIYIQVCSCVIKENADKIFRKLSDQGYSPLMEEIVRNVKMHNIYTEDFAKKSKALEFLNNLKIDGFDSVILPSSGNGYKIRITSCFYMESAKGVIKRLNRLGYETNMRKEFIPTKMYSVLLGNFESLQEAKAASQQLIKMGYPQPILKHNPKT